MRPMLLMLLFAAPLAAQARPEDAAVMAPIHRLFDGMRTHDSTLIRSAFITGAQMMGQVPKADGPQQVRFSSIDGFVSQAGRPGEAWDEQIYDPVIQVDGGLATVWVFYTFSLGGTFSHCGYDALHLVQTTDGWKIAMIADTRRSTDCGTEGRRKG